jgi:DNA helicase-2/ATP-dependent DNA helicase PcrA
LAEQAAHQAGPPALLPPNRESVSGLVRRVTDPTNYWLDLRRPIPQRPTTGAQLGTTFHEWVEGFLGGPACFSDEELSLTAADDLPPGVTARLCQTFKQSWWADQSNGLTKQAVELPFAMTLGGGQVVGRIDAVFRDQQGDYVVVDWKTGPIPKPAQLPGRLVQLRIYRLAVAQLMGVDCQNVKAAFYHVGQDQTIWLEIPPGQADRAELDNLFRQGNS